MTNFKPSGEQILKLRLDGSSQLPDYRLASNFVLTVQVTCDMGQVVHNHVYISAKDCLGREVHRNIFFFPGEIQHVTSISKPKYVILSPGAFKNHSESLRKQAFVNKILIFGDSPSADVISYNELCHKKADLSSYRPVDYYGSVLMFLIKIQPNAKHSFVNEHSLISKYDFFTDQRVSNMIIFCYFSLIPLCILEKNEHT